MIEPYVREFDRWTVGSPHEREEWRAELVAHLREAEAAGELDQALARLGSAKDAARAFSGGRVLAPASLKLRFRAALVDYAPLFVLGTLVPLVLALRSGSHVVAVSFPAGFTWNGARSTAENVTGVVSVAVALGWTVLGLSRLEARAGRTPGKALVGIMTVSEDGTAITRRQAIMRRLPVLFGPAFVLDIIVARFGASHRRAFDYVAQTMVVEDPSRRVGASAQPVPEGTRR